MATILRKSIILIFSVTLGGWLTGCGQVAETQSTDTSEGQKKVLTTFTVLSDIAQNVAGDNLEVESITRLGAEIHGYEPTPSD